MSRHFAPISENELKERVEKLMEDGVGDLLDKLGRDIKVKFDLENVTDWPSYTFGPEELIGVHTTPNGLTYYGICAGGDWEMPVFFIVYWDGKKLRGYVPTEGNPWNTTTKQAYGNDDAADAKDVHKRWPGKYDKKIALTIDEFAHDASLILADIWSRILPVGEKGAKRSEPTYDTLDSSLPAPTHSVTLAADFLAKLVEIEMGARNGRTALYWHLIYTIQQHAGRKYHD